LVDSNRSGAEGKEADRSGEDAEDCPFLLSASVPGCKSREMFKSELYLPHRAP